MLLHSDLFCHGLVVVNPLFDHVRNHTGHDRHIKADKIAHGNSPFRAGFVHWAAQELFYQLFILTVHNRHFSEPVR